MWNDPSTNEFGFQIQREQRIGGVYTNTTDLGTVGANVTTRFDIPPATGQFWRYRVRAFNAAGSGAWSNWATFAN
jgi:hypothetical protein